MLSGITTEAFLTGATVVGYVPGSVVNVTDVQALDDATLLAASGAAALVSANASSVKNSVAVAGTVAFLQNQNATLAFISGHANITSAGVTVAALTGGAEVAAGLGVSVNTSKNTSGTNLSVAGSVSIMLIQQATDAYIADSTLTAAAATAPATVEAYSDTKLGIGGGALAFGRGDAVGATVTYLEIDDPSQSGDNTGLAIDAKVSGAALSGFGAVTVDAGDAQKIAAGALMVAASLNGDAFGGVAVVNLVNGTTSAEIVNDGATAASITNASSVLVRATGEGNARLDGIVAASGTLTSNDVSYDFNDTTAGESVGSGASLIAVAGAITASKGESSAGFAVLVDEINQTRSAQISGSTVTIASTATAASCLAATGASCVVVHADDIDAILGIAAGIAVSGSTMAASGSVAVSSIDNTVTARIGSPTATSPATAVTAPSVIVNAVNDATVGSFAGNVALSKGTAIGAAIGYNQVGGTVTAEIDATTLTNTGAVTIAATENGSIQAVAVAGAGGKDAAVAGSATANRTSGTVVAGLNASTLLDSAAVVSVAATDTAAIQSLAGSVAGSGDASVGAAIAVNIIGDAVTAEVSGGTLAVKGLTVAANASGAIQTLAIGVAASGEVAVAGSVATNLMNEAVTADIGNGADVTAANNVAILAGNSESAAVIAGAAGIGLSAFGAGLSVVVNVTNDTTQAFISGATTKVDANGGSGASGGSGANGGSGSDTVAVASGDLAAPIGVGSIQAPSASTPNMAETTVNVSGLAIVATSDQAVVVNAVTLGLAFDPVSAGLAVNVVTDLFGGSTTSGIADAAVDTRLTADPTVANYAPPQLDITAASHQYSGNFVLSGAVGGFGGSGAVAVTHETRATRAYTSNAVIGTLFTNSQVTDTYPTSNAAGQTTVDDNATPTTHTVKTLLPVLGAVSLKARSSQDNVTIVAGLAAGLVGVSGSAAVNVFNPDTEASIDQGSLVAGRLTVTADSEDGYNGLVGAVAGGGTGIAAAVGVDSVRDVTKAFIGDVAHGTLVQLAGSLVDTASTTDNLNSLLVSGAGAGGVGLAGMVDVTMVDNTTIAGLYGLTLNPASSSTTTQDAAGDTVVDWTGGGRHLGTPAGDVTVTAAETIAVNAEGGALAGGGASADAVTLQSTTRAEIDGSTISAAGHQVHVNATSDKAVRSFAATAAVGGSAGVSGTVGLILIGQGSEGAGQGQIGGALAQAAGIGNQGGEGDNDPSIAAPGTLDSAASYDLTAALNAGSTDSVTAAISGGAVTAGLVSATATAWVSTDNTAAAAALGGVAGVGGGVAFTRIYDDVAAAITQAAISSDNVVVAATVADGTGGKAGVAHAYAGGGGLVGLGAGVADVLVTNQVTATMGSATGSSDGDASVLATDSSSLSSTTAGGAVGAVAAGVMVSNAAKTSTVAASLAPPAGGVAATLSGYRNVSIEASGSGSVGASATAVSGGLAAAGNAAAALASDADTVSARVGAGDVIATGAGLVYVAASDAPQVSAVAFGVSISGGLALGASVATASATPTVVADVGDGSVISGNGGLGVFAGAAPAGQADSVYAKAFAGSGAILASANAAVAIATDGGAVSALVGAGVTLPGGDIGIVGSNATAVEAIASGVSVGGFVSVGAAVAQAIDGTSSAPVSTEADLASGAIFAAGRRGALSIQALGNDLALASATAGSGGLLAGSAAVAQADSYANTNAGLEGAGSGTETIDAGSLQVSATHLASFGAITDATNAAALGASGASSSSAVTSNVGTAIGDHLDIVASGPVVISATNRFVQGDSAKGAAGGVISGSAAFTQATLTGTINAVTIGADTTIVSGTDPVSNPGQIELVAATVISGTDTVSLSTGAGIDVADVKSETDARIDNAVTLAGGDVLRGYGNVGIGTYTQADGVGNDALVSTWGGVAVGVATANTSLDLTQTVAIGAGSVVEGDGQVNVTAGNDPTSYFPTLIALNPVAQAYVSGLIAVPAANATATTNSNSALTLSTGAEILAGNNVVVGAYSGEIDNTPSGTGRGYELGFIPVTDGSSDTNTTRGATMVNDGTVLAGRFNNITLNIADCGSAGSPYCSHVAQAGGDTDVAYSYSTFNPIDFIASHWSGVDQQLLDDGSANATVGVITLGNLYASGGVVTVNADTLSGNGSITANGSPTIKVVNASPDYLVLGAVTIPNTLAGSVLFTGRADQAAAAAAGITVVQAGPGSAPSVDIENTYTGSADGSSGPALFQIGNITNLGGPVKLYNATGSYGATGGVYANSVNISAPQGSVAINVPNPPGIELIGGVPSIEWQAYAIFPGGNPSTSLPDAAGGAAYLANIYSGYSGTDVYGLNNALIGTAGGRQQHSEVFFGGCTPAALGTDCGSGNATDLSPNRTGAFNLTNDFYFPEVPIVALNITAASSSASNQSGASTTNPGISGSRVAVTAAYIDINGQVNVGPPTSWSVDLPASLTAAGGQVAQDQYEYSHGQVANPVFTLSGLSGIATGDSVVTVSYNAQTGQLTLANVIASAGGAYLLLNGSIISTNALGNIHVNGGEGKVAVTNETALTLDVQNIYAGTNANTAAANSTVEIIDQAKNSASNHSWYVYTPGGGITEYQGAATTTFANATVVASLGSSTTYTPQAGLVYDWTEQATLHREVVDIYNAKGNLTGLSASNWQFTSGASNNPWLYVSSTAAVSPNSQSYDLSTTPQGIVSTGNTGTAAFTETITGGVTGNNSVGIAYHGCGGSVGDGCHYGFVENSTDGSGNPSSNWYYNFATDGWLKLNFQVKADNSFGISFSGGSVGGVAVTSLGSLTLSGQIANPSGSVALTASGGGILQVGNALITTHVLTLAAAGAIGSVAQPLQALLTGGGQLSAASGAAGIDIHLASGAALGSIAAGNATVGFGDVALTAAGDLQPTAGSTVNVTGRNITLASQGAVGAVGAPLVIDANRSGQGGVVNISALNAIDVTQASGDLLVGAITSTNGDVVVNAPGGAVLDASQATPASVLSDTQVASVWRSLHLTAANGAAANADATSVKPIESMVDSDYRQYWLLVGSGSVSNGALTLTSVGLARYRAQATASLGLAADASDVQVQAFAVALYAKLTGAFASDIGAGWQATTDFAAFNSQFAYTISAARVAQIEQSSTWIQAQLLDAISLTALQPSANSTVGIGVPNISGRNVTINAAGSASGGIGQLARAINITLQEIRDGTLTPTQQAALSLAHTPGEISIYGTDSHGNTVTIPVAGLATTTDTVVGINIRQIAPLFVNALGNLNASSGSLLYLQATNNDLTIGQVSAVGEVTLTAPEAILSAGTAATQVKISGAGDLTLLAGTGGIGAAATPLVIAIGNNHLASATAAGGIYITATGADLTLGRIASGGMVALTATNGSILASPPGIDLLADNANLVASANIGSAALPLDLEIVNGGQLDGSAGGSATLYGAALPLTVGSFSANSGLMLTTDSTLVAQSLQALHGSITVAAGADATLHTVTSGGATKLAAVGGLKLGNITSGGTLTATAGGTLKVLANSTVSSGATLAFTAAAIDVSGSVTVKALSDIMMRGDAILLGGVIASPTMVTLEPLTDGTAITVGTGAAGLVIATAGANAIATPLLVIGDSVAGGITFDAAFSAPSSTKALELLSAGSVTQTAGSPIMVSALAIAAASATLNAANQIATLAAKVTNAIALTDASSLSIGAAGPISGVAATTLVLTDSKAVTQTQKVAVTGLDLLGTGGVDTLTNAANMVATLAGNTGSISLADSGNLSIGTVGGTAGVTATTLALTDSHAVTQAQNVAVSGLDLLGAGGSYVLTLPGNTVATLAGNTGFVNLTDGAALSIGTVAGTVGMTAGTLVLSDAKPVTQTQAVAANALDLLGGGAVVLTLPTNAVAVLAGNTGAVTLTDGADLSIGTVNGTAGMTTPTLVLTDGQAVTQTQAVTAGGLDLLGAGGRYTLTLASNAVGVIAANTGTLSLTDGKPLSIGQVAGTTGITATGNVTLTADLLTFAGNALIYAPGQVVTLQPLTTGRPITLGYGSNGMSFNEANLDAVTAALLVIGNAAAGDITINQGIRPAHVASLALLSGGSVAATGGSSITIPNLAVLGQKSISLPWGNSVGQVAMSSGGDIDFADQADVVIGAVDGIAGIKGATVTLVDNGVTTQTAAVIAGGLNLLNSASTYTLTLGSNRIAVLAGNAGSVALTDAINLSIGSVDGTSGMRANTLILTDTGTVSQTAALTVGALDLLSAGGAFTLNEGDNRVGTLAGGTGAGSIGLTDQSDLIIGSVGPTSGVTTHRLALSVAGRTSQAAPITAAQLLLGGSGDYQLTNGSNLVGTLASNATGTVDLTDAENLVVGVVGGVSGVTAQTLVLSDTGTVTEAAPIVAQQALLLGQGGNYVLTNSGNVIGTLAGDTGGVTLTQNAALSIGVAGGQNGLRANSLTVSDNATMTQSQPLWLGSLNLLGAGAYTLTSGANRIAVLAATLSASTGTLTLANASDLVIGTVGSSKGVTAQTLAITENGTVTQTQAVNVGGLDLVGGGGTFHLTAAGNHIGVLAGNSSQIIDVTAAGNLIIGTVAGTSGITAPQLWLNVAGTVTQTAAVSTDGLALRGGAYTLTQGGNRVANLAANVTNLDLWSATNVLIASVDGLSGVAAPVLTFNVSAALLQDQAITATSLVLLGGNNATAVLNNGGNAVALLAGNTGSVTLTDKISLAIGAVGAVAGLTVHDLTLTDSQTVTEAAPLVASSVTLQGGGAFRLNTAGNAIGAVGGNAASINLSQAGGFNLDAVTAASLTLSSAGTVNQSQRMNVGTLVLGGTGSYQLTNGSNSVGVLSGIAGAVALADTTNLMLGALQAGTVAIADNQAVGSSGALRANTLLLQGQGSGGFTLTNVGNAIATLAASGIGGGLGVTDSAALALGNIGGTGGIQANSDVTLTADHIDLSQASLNAGNHTVTLRPLTAGAGITLGGGSAGLVLTPGSLGNVSAGVLILSSAAAGGITINQAITLRQTGILALLSGGGVQETGSGALSVSSLAVTAAAIALDGGNQVQTTALHATGGIDFNAAGNLAIGAVQGVSGVTAGAAVKITASGGNLTLDNGARVVSTKPLGTVTIGNPTANDAIVLAASQLFQNNAGSQAISVATGERYVVFSAGPWGNTGGLNGQIVSGHAFDFTTRTYSGLPTSGDLLVYASSP